MATDTPSTKSGVPQSPEEAGNDVQQQPQFVGTVGPNPDAPAPTVDDGPDPTGEDADEFMKLNEAEEDETDPEVRQHLYDQGQVEPIGNAENEQFVEFHRARGNTRTGKDPVVEAGRGVGGDFTIAPGGATGPGSGPVDAHGFTRSAGVDHDSTKMKNINRQQRDNVQKMKNEQK
jgi:hypothetical protein